MPKKPNPNSQKVVVGEMDFLKKWDTTDHTIAKNLILEMKTISDKK